MRSLILFMLFIVLAVVSLTMPAVGILTWAWIDIMSPHRLTWDFTYTLQLNLIIVIVTFIAWVVSRDPKRLPMNGTTMLILVFMAWMTFTTMTSLAPKNSWFHWNLHIKALVFALAVMAIMRSQVRIQAVIWIITLSIGYFGVKGGGFTIVNGGGDVVMGPPESIISDRNHLALACCMVIPLMNYLRVTTANRLIRIGLVMAIILTIISVIGSYSRGGFLALSVMGFLFWLRSSGKLLTATLLLVSFVPAVMLMPQEWKERMGSIENFQEDGSVQGRFDAWNYALRVAVDRPVVGGGLTSTEVRQVFRQYVPGRPPRAAHSIYFQVLGDQGFIGLGIFLAIGLAGLLNTRKLIKLSRRRPEFSWAFHLGRMMEVSFITYFVGGRRCPWPITRCSSYRSSLFRRSRRCCCGSSERRCVRRAGLAADGFGPPPRRRSELSVKPETRRGTGRWCSELSVDAVGLSTLLGYAMRTESGRPASIMRLRTATPMAASACWPGSFRA